MEANKDIELLRQRLCFLKKSCIKAILLFGSRARGESKDRSDVDLLVLHEGCKIKDAILRRRHLYRLLHEAVGEEFEELTVIDMELKFFLNPKEINSLLLNIYWDAIVVYDLTGSIEGFLKGIKENILKSGLKRVRDKRAYYWVLPEPLKEVKIF